MDMDKELDCSEGARMLVERMQTHPKDFKPGGRFYRIAEQVMGLAPRGYGELSDRDDDALTAAYEKYILEPQLTEFVVDEIFNGDRRRAEEQQSQADRYSKSLAASMMATKNAVSSNAILGAHMLGTSAGNAAQQGQIIAASNTSTTSGQQWFEEERRRLKEMTDNTLKKLKRNKSK
jgi:hypothetical protein